MLLLQGAGGLDGYMNIIFLVGIFVVFYFFMIRPQQKKQKDLKRFREALKKGDQVITAGGVHGKVIEVNGTVVTLDVDRGTKLTMEISSISSPIGAEDKKEA